MELLKDAEVWILLAFILAFGFLAWKASPRLIAMLDQRAGAIKADLESAERLRDDAQKVLAQFQRKQGEALKEADMILASARAEADRAVARAEQAAAAAFDRRRRSVNETFALDQAKAEAEVRCIAVEVAVAAVQRALVADLDTAWRNRLVDDAIMQLSRALQPPIPQRPAPDARLTA